MNYNEIESITRAGINFFSDANGVYEMSTGAGYVEIVNGVEVEVPAQTFQLKGLVREIKTRDIDGEFTQFGDKRGIFTAQVEIKQGYQIKVDSETFVVIDPRPVKPTGTVVGYRPILRRVATYG